jgi:aldose sugar dehydrogenase
MNLAVAFLLFSLFACSQCKKSTRSNNSTPGTVAIKDSVITGNLNHPWEITWGPDNHIWMTERGGRVSRVNPANGAVIPLITISEVVSNGEGGLLGMALHPDFSSNPYVYVSYDYNNPSGYREKIVRYTYNGSTLINPTVLLDNIMASSIHNGCRLVISSDLKLFITTGDASNQSLPQNTGSVNGKVLRINLDGSIPPDNPIPGNPYWSFGHRNAQGLVLANGMIYVSEHGPANDDEINIVEKGRNYGWPAVEGYCNTGSEQSFCSANNVKEPIMAWTPTAAVCGMDYYNKDLVPQWKNSLLMVALKNARLYQMKLDATFKTITETNEYLNNDYGRLRDICIAPDGRIFVCSSNGGGDDKIIVIKPM